MTKNIWKIYPLFKFSNINDPENRVETRYKSRVEVREIVGLYAPMNKIGRPTYLINDKEYLIVAAAKIEGGHGLPLDSNYILGKLYHIIMAVKCWCDDNDILKNVTPKVFPQTCQTYKRKGELS